MIASAFLIFFIFVQFTNLRWMNGQHLRSFSSEQLTKLIGQHWKSTGILAESEGMFVEVTTLFHIPFIQSVP